MENATQAPAPLLRSASSRLSMPQSPQGQPTALPSCRVRRLTSRASAASVSQICTSIPSGVSTTSRLSISDGCARPSVSAKSGKVPQDRRGVHHRLGGAVERQGHRDLFWQHPTARASARPKGTARRARSCHSAAAIRREWRASRIPLAIPTGHSTAQPAPPSPCIQRVRRFDEIVGGDDIGQVLPVGVVEGGVDHARSVSCARSRGIARTAGKAHEVTSP